MVSLPAMNMQLRKLSAELDRKIADLLASDQRERLARMLVRASNVEGFVPHPGVGRPWRAKLEMK
jgi:hypothetical protein